MDMVEMKNESAKAAVAEVSVQMREPFDTTDNFLQALVRLANEGVGFGITLTVGGFLISGILVGGKEYFNEHVLESMSKDRTDASRKLVEAFVASFTAVYDLTPSQAEEMQPVTTFIHLKDARFFHHSGKPIPANRSVWWRGRLSEVDGFSLGMLTDQPRP